MSIKSDISLIYNNISVLENNEIIAPIKEMKHENNNKQFIIFRNIQPSSLSTGRKYIFLKKFQSQNIDNYNIDFTIKISSSLDSLYSKLDNIEDKVAFIRLIPNIKNSKIENDITDSLKNLSEDRLYDLIKYDYIPRDILRDLIISDKKYELISDKKININKFISESKMIGVYGAIGSGKTVTSQTILTDLFYKNSKIKMWIIDPTEAYNYQISELYYNEINNENLFVEKIEYYNNYQKELFSIINKIYKQDYDTDHIILLIDQYNHIDNKAFHDKIRELKRRYKFITTCLITQSKKELPDFVTDFIIHKDDSQNKHTQYNSSQLNLGVGDNSPEMILNSRNFDDKIKLNLKSNYNAWINSVESSINNYDIENKI